VFVSVHGNARRNRGVTPFHPLDHFFETRKLVQKVLMRFEHGVVDLAVHKPLLKTVWIHRRTLSSISLSPRSMTVGLSETDGTSTEPYGPTISGILKSSVFASLRGSTSDIIDGVADRVTGELMPETDFVAITLNVIL
jgi:hypothetical protein